MKKGLVPTIRDFFFGDRPAAASPKRLRARYDIAQTNHDNARQWEGADGLDADAANSPGVRQLARNRSRTETQNNPTLCGIVRTICDYEVGTGATLNVEHDDEDFCREIEERWREWADAVNFPGKLRQMVYGRVVDGESFARIGLNPALADPVKLDFQPFECRNAQKRTPQKPRYFGLFRGRFGGNVCRRMRGQPAKLPLTWKGPAA